MKILGEFCLNNLSVAILLTITVHLKMIGSKHI